MTATTTPAFGLREHALDALDRARKQLAQQRASENLSRRTSLAGTLRMRMVRLFNVDGVPLTEDEERFFTPEWFTLERLDPGVDQANATFSHVNGFTPVCIIEGVMLAPDYNGLVVGTWSDDGPPTDLTPIVGIIDLGSWVEQVAQHEAEMAVRTEDEG